MDRNNKASGWIQVAPSMPGNMPAANRIPEETVPMQPPHSMPELAPVPMPVPEPIRIPAPTPPVPSPNHSLCDDMVLVMSYVKKQEWDQTYEAETALERGTIFPELDLPFVGEGGCRYD